MDHNINYSNFNTICRICLVQKEDLMPVNSAQIVSMFEECTSLEESLYEKLPKQICSVCYWQLKNAYEFKQQCILSLEILCDILLQENINKATQNDLKNTDIVTQSETKNVNILTQVEPKNVNIVSKIVNNGEASTALKNELPNFQYTKSDLFEEKSFTNLNEDETVDENEDEFDNTCEDDGIEQLSNDENAKKEIPNFSAKLEGRQRSLADILRKKYNIYDLMCNICKKELSTRATLLRHMDTHNKNRVLKFHCSTCKKGFYTADNYKKHVDRHLGKTKYQCDLCPRRFYVLSALGFHSKTTHKAKGIQCEKCSAIFYHRLQLEHHEETAHEKKGFICDTCGKVYWKRCHLRLHQITHSEQRNFTCEYCNKCFKHKGTLKEHIKLQHIEPDRREMCNFCGKLVMPATLRSHLESHDKETFPCHHCGKVYNSKYVMRAHIKEKHSSEHVIKYHCKICDRALSSRGCLATHMRLTHGENLKRIKCHICDKTFKTMSHVKVHVNSAHLDIRPHVCQTCLRAFHSKTQLNKHMRSHTGERPFPCNLCGKAFAFKTVLKTHMKVHLKINTK